MNFIQIGCKRIYRSTLTASILTISTIGFANDGKATEAQTTKHVLPNIEITVDSSKEEQKLGETVIQNETISQQMINNSHDLVRYNTEVDVAEVGRYGNKGFAIRGVDGNRVAMSIDGMALPEVESNEVFSPYGYNYEGRFNPDLELMGSVRIHAGADSLASGSGALGGAVNYSSKNYRDLISANKPFGGYGKIGYSNKNEEKFAAAGIAGKVNQFDFLLNYVRREGHELKNHDMRSHNPARLDINYNFPDSGELGRRSQPSSALYPDALNYQRDAVLGKIYYNLTDAHRIGASALYQQQTADSYAYSKTLGGRNRMAHDREQINAYGLEYQYQPSQSKWLDQLGLQYQYQDVQGIADTHIYTGFLGLAHTSTEYRPTQTQNHQVRFNTLLRPFDWGFAGSHQFNFGTSYSKQDFTQSHPVARFKTDGSLESADQGNVILFADAKKDIYNFTLSDKIVFNDRLKAGLGVRYDHYTYSPYFQNETWFGTDATNEQNILNRQLANNSTLKLYQDYRDGFYSRKVKLDKFTYNALVDFEVLPEKLTARYKFGTGFLAPNVTQMYSAFQGLGVTQLANTDLKPESSKNHELEFEYKATPNTTLTLGGYLSNYKDFIYTRYWQHPDSTPDRYGCTRFLGLCAASINLNSAQVQGLKIGVESDLSEKFDTQGKLTSFINFHTARDKAKIQTDKNGTLEINTLAAVPTGLTMGVDFKSADESWSLHGRARATWRKKAKDTKVLETEDIISVATRPCSDITFFFEGEAGCSRLTNARQDQNLGSRFTNFWVFDRETVTGYNEVAKSYDLADRGKNVILFDLFGTKAFGKNKNLVLNAGVYNMFDIKYIPWETLRQFSNANANSMVDRDRLGLNRYTAPGRNYSVSLEYKF